MTDDPAPQPVDLDALADTIGLSRDDVVELIQLFFETAPTYMATIREHMTDGDIVRARRAAHSMRGTAATLHMNGIAELAGTLEKAARAEQRDPLPAIADALDTALASARKRMADAGIG